MGLFIKKPETGTYVPMYSMQQQETWLIVGLGNIGGTYENTRHNIGFVAIDAVVASFELSWQNKPSLKCMFASQLHGHKKLLFCKPTTFMNASGEAVQALKQFYKISLHNIIVIHDDIDIKFGEIRSRQGGSSAGNNGIKSISEHLSEDYWRVRIGIGPKLPEQIDSAAFVLAPFSTTQMKKIVRLTELSAEISLEIINGNHEPTTKRISNTK